MNKVFEKILDGIESLKSNKGFGGTIQTMYADGMLDKAKEIVREVAEEYNNGWVPCSERMPEETEKLYLVTYKKFILGNFRYFIDIAYLSPLPEGTLEWVSEKAPVTRKVEAWQDLPEEYKGIK